MKLSPADLERRRMAQVALYLRESDNASKKGGQISPLVAWTDDDIKFLKKEYPQRGCAWCAAALGRTKSMIASKACRLGLRADRQSEHFKEWQSRAAASKAGKKRPEQALVLARLRERGVLHVYTPERLAAMSEKTKKQWRETPHPRGYAGKKASAEKLLIMSARSREAFSRLTEEQVAERSMKMLKTRLARYGTLANPRPLTSWKSGWREIGGARKYYRSRWEANYARYLEWLKANKQISKWEHEPETFWFEGVKRGCVSYLPDFRVVEPDGCVCFHEVKGWMDARSATKIKRMAKYYPSVKLIIVAAKQYKEIEQKMGAIISGWEFSK